MELAKSGRKRSRTSGGGGTAAAAVERKEIERRRRNEMKILCLKLDSIVPKEHRSKDAMTQLGSLDDAAAYIKKIKERVDELQRRTTSSGGGGVSIAPSTTTTTTTTSGGGGGGAGSEDLEGEEEAAAPVVEVRYHDDSSLLDVVLVCSAGSGRRRPFRFHEVIAVLDEEGAEILNASHSVAAAGQKIFCTIHARAFSSRIGVEVARVSERLRALLR